MENLYEIALNELDRIVFEEYETTRLSISPIFEDKGDDSALSLPLERAASYPFRAIRYRKAKGVMKKYLRRILDKSERIILGYEGELNKSIPEIERKGKDLQNRLEKARKSGDEVGARSIVSQQKEYRDDVKKTQDARVQNLNQSIDNLISTYTTAIHKRIDEPGYVLKVELSDRGKADLKAIWDEKVAIVRQKIYEKLIKIINNQNVKGLEALISRLEIEIEDAEDQRRVSRLRREKIRKSAEDESPRIIQKAGEEDKDAGGEGDEKKPEEEKTPGYAEIKEYLEENLPEGLLEEEDYYSYYAKSKTILHVYIEVDDDEQRITAVFYKEGEDPDDDPIKEIEIGTQEDAEDLVDRIDKGEEMAEDVDKDRMVSEWNDTLFDHLETLFKARPKFIKDTFSYEFYMDWRKTQNLKNFAKYAVGEIIDNPKSYGKQTKLLNSQQISDRQIVNLFIKKFRDGYQKFHEGFVPLKYYKKMSL